jgi:hypothetical protein
MGITMAKVEKTVINFSTPDMSGSVSVYHALTSIVPALTTIISELAVLIKA